MRFSINITTRSNTKKGWFGLILGGYVTNRLGIMSQHGPISKEYKSVLIFSGSLNN